MFNRFILDIFQFNFLGGITKLLKNIFISKTLNTSYLCFLMNKKVRVWFHPKLSHLSVATERIAKKM